jgi:hypothetical protein
MHLGGIVGCLSRESPGSHGFFFWHFPLGSTKDFTWASANGTSSAVSPDGFFFFDVDEVEGD